MQTIIQAVCLRVMLKAVCSHSPGSHLHSCSFFAGGLITASLSVCPPLSYQLLHFSVVSELQVSVRKSPDSSFRSEKVMKKGYDKVGRVNQTFYA